MMEGERMINLNEILHRLIAEYIELDEIIGITMSGSKVSNHQDDLSDINLDLYVREDLSIEKRRQIMLKFSSKMENNRYTTDPSDYFLLDEFPIQMTVYYIDLVLLKSELNRVLEEGVAKIGYTTRVAYNFLNATIVYDRFQELTKLQSQYEGDYPNHLKENIISLNFPLLKSSISSYYHQLQQAINRQDRIVIFAVVNKFLVSYFDVLFALNKCYNPGEKRLVQIAKERCQYCPMYLEENIDALLLHTAKGEPQLLEVIEQMIYDLQVPSINN